MQHPDIATRQFTYPQDSEACFAHFSEGFAISPEELLTEIRDGIAARHGQAVPIGSPVPDQPAYLVELARFLVVYHLPTGRVEVATILAKHDLSRPDLLPYFSSTSTLPDERRSHADIGDKPITYVRLDQAFLDFAVDVCQAASGDLLLDDLEDTIRGRHGAARRISWPQQPRPLWELETHFLRFQYQVLADRIEVGSIWSRATGVRYEPSQDLLAE